MRFYAMVTARERALGGKGSNRPALDPTHLDEFDTSRPSSEAPRFLTHLRRAAPRLAVLRATSGP
jgi:hypothetical protein